MPVENSYAKMGEEERPLSFYDNLSSDNNNSKKFQFADIQFKFDDDILSVSDRKSVINNAKSEFFGLNGIKNQNNVDEMQPERDTTGSGGAGANNAATNLVDGDDEDDDDSQKLVESNKNQIMAEDGNDQQKQHKNILIKIPEIDGPSQAVYMTTTVPQNIKKNKDIMGRHKPTRSSLRHSRMLVVNKSYHQRYSKHNSLNMQHIKVSRTLLVLKILIGGLLTIFGLFLLLWSPNTQTKDNPYWSGLILIVCGGLFLILLEFKRNPQNRLKENLFNFIQINSLFILLLTIFFTMLAFIYALIQVTNLSSSHLKCDPVYLFNINSSSCICFLNYSNDEANGLENVNESIPATEAAVIFRKDERDFDGRNNHNELHYRDFNCSEVLGYWFYLALGSSILNSIGCLLAVIFLILFAIGCKRKNQKYISVKTSSAQNATSTTDNMTLSSTSSA